MDEPNSIRAQDLARQAAWLEAAGRRLAAIDHRFFLARLGLVLAGFVAIVVSFSAWSSPAGWGVSLGFVICFAVLVLLHRRLDRRRKRVSLETVLTASRLARLQLDWKGIPLTPEMRVDPQHPFASDLNLLGDRSLHQLLDTASSRGGSQRLADWLLAPALDKTAVCRRQALVAELVDLGGFRRSLALRGLQVREELKAPWDGARLMSWLERGPASRKLLPVLVVLLVLAGVNVVLYVLAALGALPGLWGIGLALYGLVYLWRYNDYKELFEEAYGLGKSLDQFRGVLEFLETYPYPQKSGLESVCAPFLRAGGRPSRYLRGIVAITSAASLEGNPILALTINLLLPWNLFFAYLLERYKASLRAVLPAWLDAWYELEALASLANFAHLHPNYTFPQIGEGGSDGSPLFEACALGHPLLPAGTRVRNDFTVHRLGEIAIVTGSNMSGKSTFLRTLGTNLCLAYAGGPVVAAQMKSGLFRLFTCIQVEDSLSDGISYFYAEVRRLKALLVALEAQDPNPVFFLIDEIFRGTNNRERKAGSRAYVRALARGRGAGVISTHDLELVQLAGIGSNILNYHFREEVHSGKMDFDYRLRPGPCPTTNALKIMAMEGLPVEEAENLNHETSLRMRKARHELHGQNQSKR